MICSTCNIDTEFPHDHCADLSGLDDGPVINPPRKKMAAKPPEETRAIRQQAWATRREKYGSAGHR